MAETEAEKKNVVHIRRVAEFADQIFALNTTIKTDKGLASKDNSKLLDAAASILRTIRGHFNNREMSLVCTKLEEASHWMVEGNAEQVKLKLTEARNWAIAYIEFLKTD